MGVANAVLGARGIDNFGAQWNGTLSDPPTNLDPVVATAPSPDNVSGDFGGSYGAFFSSTLPASPPLDDHEQPIGPDDPPLAVDPQAVLAVSPEFAKLPPSVQEMITHTPTLALQLANFFTSGGTIDVSQSLGDMTAQYDPNCLVIRIDANTVQTMMVGTNTYPNADDLMLSIVSHEAAHYILDMAGTHIFDVTGSEAAYQAHQAQHEALAIANSMIAANEYALATGEVPTLMGYGSESVLRPHLNAFLTTGDFDTLINSLSGLVLDFPWNGTDVNGDGVVNQRDKFSQEFRNWKAENGL